MNGPRRSPTGSASSWRVAAAQTTAGRGAPCPLLSSAQPRKRFGPGGLVSQVHEAHPDQQLVGSLPRSGRHAWRLPETRRGRLVIVLPMGLVGHHSGKRRQSRRPCVAVQLGQGPVPCPLLRLVPVSRRLVVEPGQVFVADDALAHRHDPQHAVERRQLDHDSLLVPACSERFRRAGRSPDRRPRVSPPALPSLACLPPPERPRPPQPRSSLGLASLTFRLRTSTCLSESPVMATLASASRAISTKPKPLERPVSRSMITWADCTVP